MNFADLIGRLFGALFSKKPVAPTDTPSAPAAAVPSPEPPTVEPAPAAEPAPPKKLGKAAIIAAAVAVAAPLTMTYEGYSGKAYYDPAHILTQCYGETRDIDPAMIYSKDQCATKLRARMAADYAPKLVTNECMPQLLDERRVKVFAALLDASYNAGPAAVCKSPMAIAVRAGNWLVACDKFQGWYTSAKNRKTGQRIVFKGLVIRRQKEASLCGEGI